MYQRGNRFEDGNGLHGTVLVNFVNVVFALIISIL